MKYDRQKWNNQRALLRPFFFLLLRFCERVAISYALPDEWPKLTNKDYCYVDTLQQNIPATEKNKVFDHRARSSGSRTRSEVCCVEEEWLQGSPGFGWDNLQFFWNKIIVDTFFEASRFISTFHAHIAPSEPALLPVSENCAYNGAHTHFFEMKGSLCISTWSSSWTDSPYASRQSV